MRAGQVSVELVVMNCMRDFAKDCEKRFATYRIVGTRTVRNIGKASFGSVPKRVKW